MVVEDKTRKKRRKMRWVCIFSREMERERERFDEARKGGVNAVVSAVGWGLPTSTILSHSTMCHFSLLLLF